MERMLGMMAVNVVVLLSFVLALALEVLLLEMVLVLMNRHVDARRKQEESRVVAMPAPRVRLARRA